MSSKPSSRILRGIVRFYIILIVRNVLFGIKEIGTFHERAKVVDSVLGYTSGIAECGHTLATRAKLSMRPSFQHGWNDQAALGAACRRSFSKAPGRSKSV